MLYKIFFVSITFIIAPTLTPATHQAHASEPHRERYAVKTAAQKITDNQGNGFEALYGTRNMRAVLNGVYYRGGANNYYHRKNKRENQNPLPNDGLQNLCEEGFGQAVYLYSTNFNTAPKTVSCRTFSGQENRLDYVQISPLSYDEADQKKLLTLIHDHIRDPNLGPIYDHCWNGWHASGFVAALALRQFCGFNGEEAVSYWNLNTDGNNEGSSYDRIRQKIRGFQAYQDLLLSEKEKAAICPEPGTLAF